MNWRQLLNDPAVKEDPLAKRKVKAMACSTAKVIRNSRPRTLCKVELLPEDETENGSEDEFDDELEWDDQREDHSDEDEPHDSSSLEDYDEELSVDEELGVFLQSHDSSLDPEDYDDELGVIRSGLVERSMAGSGFVDIVINIVGLAYGVIGLADFASEVVDTAVTQQRGYAILNEWAGHQVQKDKKTLCKGATSFWIDLIKTHAIAAATIEGRYFEAQIPYYVRNWLNVTYHWGAAGGKDDDDMPDLTEGSEWICTWGAWCLAPKSYFLSSAKSGKKVKRTSGVNCATRHGDMKVCRDGSNVDRIAPFTCFGIFHDEASDVWRYGAEGDAMLEQASPFDLQACQAPLKEVHDSALAVQDAIEKVDSVCGV